MRFSQHCWWSYTSCEMTAYRLDIINESTRHHLYLVRQATSYGTVYLPTYNVAIPDDSIRNTVRCVRHCTLPMKHTDPLSLLKS